MNVAIPQSAAEGETMSVCPCGGHHDFQAVKENDFWCVALTRPHRGTSVPSPSPSRAHKRSGLRVFLSTGLASAPVRPRRCPVLPASAHHNHHAHARADATPLAAASPLPRTGACGTCLFCIWWPLLLWCVPSTGSRLLRPVPTPTAWPSPTRSLVCLSLTRPVHTDTLTPSPPLPP